MMYRHAMAYEGMQLGKHQNSKRERMNVALLVNRFRHIIIEAYPVLNFDLYIYVTIDSRVA